MPIGPITLICLAAAIVFAVLRSRAEQSARRNRVPDDSDDDPKARVRLSTREPSFTKEGQASRKRAIRYRILFFAFSLGALAAAWMGL